MQAGNTSVIIPSYNDGETIGRAISSVLGQSIPVKEIIVVDDASTDSTEQIVEAFEDDRVTYVKHQQNEGGSAARNTGLEYSSGEYIAYLDADDEWHPRKLEKQLITLEAKSEEWVAVHCDRTWDISLSNKIAFALSTIIGTKESDPPMEGGEELIKEVLSLNLSTGASTLVAKREVVETLDGFDEDFPRHQDWEFVIRILQQGKLAYVDEPLVIKHGTGRPSIETYEEGKKQLLTKFDKEVTELERRGHEITHIQQLQLTKLYIADGYFSKGFRRLDYRELGLREVLSVLWYVPEGVSNHFSKRVFSDKISVFRTILNKWIP